LGLTVDDAVTRLQGVRLVGLGEPDLALWRLPDSYAAAQQEIVAGAIANQTAGVAGLSNVFVNGIDETAAWAALVDMASDAFPGLPLVGYERSATLDVARACGFQPIGPLRVWTHQG
jgi:hypothetical protein